MVDAWWMHGICRAYAWHTHGIRMAMRIVYAWYMQSMATDAAHLAARAGDEEDLPLLLSCELVVAW